MSVLKKEFKKQDVERIRNLVKGKYGDKTRSSVGFTKKTEFHKEGDIWESDGRFWTIKDGIKQNVTKFTLTLPDTNNTTRTGERDVKVVSQEYTTNYEYDNFYTLNVTLRRVFEA
mgnify:CR=1 FL=1